MDKRERAELFRQRLSAAMALVGLSRSGLGRAVGVNRSTVSQLLSPDEARLPNAQLVAECAATLGVSSDWLLGLTDRLERPGDILAAAVTVTDTERSGADEQILRWHREAQGYKIRYVPATMPDMLKTEEVLNWEYAAYLGRTSAQAIAAMRDRLAWLRSGPSDYEIAIPLHEVTSLAAGEGYYRGLSPEVRRRQMVQLADHAREFYPTVRIFLFDARQVFSAPLTVFGPLMAVIYVGRFYLAFREKERVHSLITHFDWLVREAEVDARDFPDFAAALAEG